MSSISFVAFTIQKSATKMARKSKNDPATFFKRPLTESWIVYKNFTVILPCVTWTLISLIFFSSPYTSDGFTARSYGLIKTNHHRLAVLCFVCYFKSSYCTARDYANCVAGIGADRVLFSRDFSIFYNIDTKGAFRLDAYRNAAAAPLLIFMQYFEAQLQHQFCSHN